MWGSVEGREGEELAVGVSQRRERGGMLLHTSHKYTTTNLQDRNGAWLSGRR